MVIPLKHLLLQIVADFVNQLNLQEWFTTDEVPDDAFFTKILFMVENIVNGSLRHLPCHPLLRVLSHEVAILTGKLAILSDDESYILRFTFSP